MIPYNPSSFNSNKTILEQILELKRWLMAHPSYEVFYSSDNGQSVAYTGYLLSSISDPTNLAVGDVVVFNNVTLGVVTSVDTDNGEFGCDPCISFKGTDGTYTHYVSITTPTGTFTASELSLLSYDDSMIIYTIGSSVYRYAKDKVSGTTAIFRRLNFQTSAPFVSMKDERFEVNTSTGAYSEYVNNIVITNDNIKPNGATGLVLTSLTSTTTGWSTPTAEGINIKSTGETSGKVLTADGSDGASWQSVPAPQGTDVLSTGETSGKVLTTDGSNGASWQSVPAPEGNDIKSTGQSAGKVILSNGADGSSWQNVPAPEGTTIKSTSETAGKVLTANGYDGASWSEIDGTQILSTGATNGQVLTADGNGGASWQNAGGGTTLNKYTYTITMNNAGIKRLHSILENAKGRAEITGRFYDNTNNVYFTGKYISTGTYWYINLANGFPPYHNYIVFGVSNSLSDGSTSISFNVRKSDDLGTEISVTSVNIFDITVTYWNDTEILS